VKYIARVSVLAFDLLYRTLATYVRTLHSAGAEVSSNMQILRRG